MILLPTTSCYAIKDGSGLAAVKTNYDFSGWTGDLTEFQRLGNASSYDETDVR